MSNQSEPDIAASTIRQAMSLMSRFPDDDNVSLMAKLIEGGIDAARAQRLIMFIPIAACRVMLKGTGIQFSPQY